MLEENRLAQVLITKMPESLRNKYLWLKSSFYPKSLRSTMFFWLVHRYQIEMTMNANFLVGLLKCVLLTEKVEGNIIELGTYRGGSTVPMAYLLKSIGSKRRIYACDTFMGHPYDDRSSMKTNRRGIFSDTSVQYVQRKFKKFRLADKIVIVKGLFEAVLEKKMSNERFSLAFVDCDLYDSSRYALEFLYPRMTGKSRIVLHDYGTFALNAPEPRSPPSTAGKFYWGITRAVNEWCEEKGLKINFNPVPNIEFS